MPTNDYLRPVWQTMYTPLDLSGKCNSFRIYIDEGISEGEMIRFSTIGFNVPVPFSMSKKAYSSAFSDFNASMFFTFWFRNI